MFDPKNFVYIRHGKKFRKIGRDEIIEEGAYHAWCGGELEPIKGIDTIGDKPSSFSDEREFFNPMMEGVKFFCKGCGREIWGMLEKYKKETLTIADAEATCFCSDCIIKNAKGKEELNHQAYMDVLDYEEPSMPNNTIYMECYRFWRPLQGGC